jgi:hypothetical protein
MNFKFIKKILDSTQKVLFLSNLFKKQHNNAQLEFFYNKKTQLK